MTKRIDALGDLTPDPGNHNAGTERGAYLLEESIAQVGAGRSILADRDGVVLAGNKALQAAADAGLGVRVVRTDGHELVVVQRTDLALSGDDDERQRARRMAYFDNRTSEIGLSYDLDQIVIDLTEGVDLSVMFYQDELEELLAGLIEPQDDGGEQRERPSMPHYVVCPECGNEFVPSE